MKKALRIFFIITNTLIVAALLLSSIAGWVPPSKCVWISFLSYGFFPLVILNILCSLLWLFFKQWEFLISLIAILLRCTMIPLFIQVGGNSEPPVSESRSAAEEFKVMSYNLHGFHGKTEAGSDYCENAARFVDAVRLTTPDVICAQEMHHSKAYSVTDSLIALGYIHIYSTQKAGRYPYGATIFSRHKFEYVHTIDESGRKIYADIQKDDFKVRVVCVHMSSYAFGHTHHDVLQDIKHKDIDTANTRRLFSKIKKNVLNHEYEWNNDLAEVVKDRPLPLIVAGDFNDTPASHLYHKISHQLNDSYVEEGSGLGITYNDPFPTYRIDYIFHSKELNTLAYRRLVSDFSDHNGIVAVFEIKQ